MHYFTGAPANDPDVIEPRDLRAELDEMLGEVAERLDELDDVALLALWRVLYGLLYGPPAGDGRGP
jgi:hypothetical protein